MSSMIGPHHGAASDDPREQFAAALLDRLWSRYRDRVAHVQAYEQLVATADAKFTNDHIAFRTLAGQIPLTGIVSISRIFEALGWRAAGSYQFPDKLLNAVHFTPANPGFPKIFVSELQLWALPVETRDLLLKSLRTHRLPISDESLANVARCGELSAPDQMVLLERVLREFHELPWTLPEKEDVEAVHQASQYAAWVLLHGYSVNHFTSLINSHGVATLDSIDKTAAALAAAGVPMKTQIEGQPGSRLRQTATAAVVIDVDVADHGLQSRMPWTYAYFELAERGEVVDPDTGAKRRFEGFLGSQATHLFEMTRREK